MTTIYADDVFLINAIIDYFILLATAKICALPLKRIRFGIAAFVGGLYSAITLLSFAEFMLHPIFKITIGLLMALIGFGGEKRFFRAFIAFIATSALFAGSVYAITLFADVDNITITHTSMKVLVLSFAISYIVLTLFFSRLTESRSREIKKISIKYEDKYYKFDALKDTGNGLFDPISGLSVMVIGRDISMQFLPSDCYNALLNNPSDFLLQTSKQDNLKSVFYLIPYSAVGIDVSMLPVFHPDELLINGKQNKSMLVGLSPTIMSNSNEFSAVI